MLSTRRQISNRTFGSGSMPTTLPPTITSLCGPWTTLPRRIDCAVAAVESNMAAAMTATKPLARMITLPGKPGLGQEVDGCPPSPACDAEDDLSGARGQSYVRLSGSHLGM